MSVVCQFCNNAHPMSRVLSLGYMPPPNDMPVLAGHEPKPQQWLPTEMWYCSECELTQLGYVPDQTVAFPEDYPYTSGATPALRENFEDLADKCIGGLNLGSRELVVDIGSNDGTLLSCFVRGSELHAQNILGIEPTAAAHLATANGIRTEKAFFNSTTAQRVRNSYGPARLITCANCFAHMPNIHDVVEGIKLLLADDGMFVSESHYLIDLIDKLQYDTIYAEHLRYYTVRSLTNLLSAHGLRVVDVERIPTHGGSIRVYAQKDPAPLRQPNCLVAEPLGYELQQRLAQFAEQVQFNKRAVLAYLYQIKSQGGLIAGVGAPSRGSTVISYLRLEQSIVEYVCEQAHSLKIGRLMPGSDIPVVDEALLYKEQPEAVILFSWHLADELIPKIRAKGYRGCFILPCSAEVVTDLSSIDEPLMLAGAL